MFYYLERHNNGQLVRRHDFRVDPIYRVCRSPRAFLKSGNAPWPVATPKTRGQCCFGCLVRRAWPPLDPRGHGESLDEEACLTLFILLFLNGMTTNEMLERETDLIVSMMLIADEKYQNGTQARRVGNYRYFSRVAQPSRRWQSRPNPKLHICSV